MNTGRASKTICYVDPALDFRCVSLTPAKHVMLVRAADTDSQAVIMIGSRSIRCREETNVHNKTWGPCKKKKFSKNPKRLGSGWVGQVSNWI